MFDSFVQSLLGLVDALGYWGVFILMTIESSFVPFPSELVVPPAAYLAAQGQMNLGLVILFAVLGSIVGALINYYLAMWLGRPVIFALLEKRWAKFLLLSKAKVEKSEKYFLEYGELSTFVGRLIPAVRQLISLPAGFSRMKIGPFIFYTTLGAGAWITVLALLGFYIGESQGLIKMYALKIAIGVVFFILLGAYLFFRKKRKKKISA